VSAIANSRLAQAWDGSEGAQVGAEAEHYERAAAHVGAVRAVVPVAEDERVLDIGCGNGKTDLRLAAAAPSGSALGIDLSAQMLANGRARRQPPD